MVIGYLIVGRCLGDDVLGSVNIKMVEVARSVGASSKFTGSGGAVVALCPDGKGLSDPEV